MAVVVISYLIHASVFVPPIFIAQDPQIPSRQERRNVNVGSISFLILIKASSTIGPHLKKICQVPERNIKKIWEKYLTHLMERDLRIHINFIFLHIWFLIRFVWIPTVNWEGLVLGSSILNHRGVQTSDLWKLKPQEKRIWWAKC